MEWMLTIRLLMHIKTKMHLQERFEPVVMGHHLLALAMEPIISEKRFTAFDYIIIDKLPQSRLRFSINY